MTQAQTSTTLEHPTEPLTSITCGCDYHHCTKRAEIPLKTAKFLTENRRTHYIILAGCNRGPTHGHEEVLSKRGSFYAIYRISQGS